MSKPNDIPEPTMQTTDRGNDIYYQIAAIVSKRTSWHDDFKPLIETLANIIGTHLYAIESINNATNYTKPLQITNDSDIEEIREFCEQVPALTMVDLKRLGYLSDE